MLLLHKVMLAKIILIIIINNKTCRYTCISNGIIFLTWADDYSVPVMITAGIIGE